MTLNVVVFKSVYLLKQISVSYISHNASHGMQISRFVIGQERSTVPTSLAHQEYFPFLETVRVRVISRQPDQQLHIK